MGEVTVLLCLHFLLHAHLHMQPWLCCTNTYTHAKQFAYKQSIADIYNYQPFFSVNTVATQFIRFVRANAIVYWAGCVCAVNARGHGFMNEWMNKWIRSWVSTLWTADWIRVYRRLQSIKWVLTEKWIRRFMAFLSEENWDRNEFLIGRNGMHGFFFF